MSPRAPIIVLAALCLGSCWRDAADREYFAALAGDEDDSTYEERIAHLDRAIELEPTRSGYYEARAILHIDHQDFGSALDDLDQAVVRGDRPYLRFLRGLARCQGGDCGAAVPDFDLAIDQQPANGQFYRGRALALVTLGRFAEGLADAERLIEMEPQVGRSYYARGVALAGLERHEDAIRDFDEALRRMPELVYPVLARADSYDAIGDSAGATSDREAATVRPGEGAPCAYCVDPFRY